MCVRDCTYVPILVVKKREFSFLNVLIQQEALWVEVRELGRVEIPYSLLNFFSIYYSCAEIYHKVSIYGVLDVNRALFWHIDIETELALILIQPDYFGIRIDFRLVRYRSEQANALCQLKSLNLSLR